MNEYLKKHTLIESHIRVSKDITNSVVGLKADIFEITAATRNPQQRVVANRKVTNDVEFIKDLASTLNVGEEEIKPIYLHLNKVQESIVHLMRLLDLRDDSLKKRQTPILPVVREIREFNLTIPARIGHLLEHVGKVQAYLDKKNDYFENEIERARIKFLYIEIAISLIIIILTLYLAGFISRQIIKLYHKIEVQLYVDDLTGLNSRRALQKDFVGVDKFTLIIFDIDSFKTINELYGPIVGNEVLTNLALLFQTYFGNTGFKLFRISGDEFVLFEQGREYKYREVEVVISKFVAFIKKNKIYIKSISENIELDFTCGVAVSEENPLGTADVALHFAKNNNLPFMLYEKDIDNKKELQSNLFWKKEIQCGITSDSFLPVFQPIVDRNGIVQKYESLMRLKKDDGKDVNYIIPIEFLDRAKKMRKYCVISAMTIFKSLEFCKKSGVGITINLDKQDMKNCQFTGKLKEKIIELDIADKIVFEILESENILDNVIIKKFILDFRGIGVKFAIDDFGSGYSNFSFILEIKPDFLKIDGSLVKNITEDRNSYELVKSIVAFAKELDIVTIAEFVHSNEVFITVLDLGVDLFQGYHFDGPKNLIETSPLH